MCVYVYIRSEMVGGDKHLEKTSSPSTSKVLNINNKEKEKLIMPSTSIGATNSFTTKNKASDGLFSFSHFRF